MVKIHNIDNNYQYTLTRLTKTIVGEKRANQYDTIKLTEPALEALLGDYYEGLLASVHLLFRQRSVFSLNEQAIHLPTAVDVLVPVIGKEVFSKGNLCAI